jgi:PhnB protein
MQAIPTIYFPGLCAEALSFYRNVLDAEVLFQLTAVPDGPPQYLAPGSPGMILRAGLRVGSTTLYLSGADHAGDLAFRGFAVSLQLAGADEAARLLQALGEGGTIRVPLRATTIAEHYGVVIDRFGLHWTIEAGGTYARAA